MLLKNLFFPKKCIFCNKLLPLSADNYWCEQCAEKLMIKDDRVCEICGMPLEIPRGEPVCKTCKKLKHSFIQNTSAFVYKDKVRSALVRMKFSKNQQWIARTFGTLTAVRAARVYRDIKFDGVTFVPISLRRELKRGYNQSEIMAAEIARALNVPLLPNALKKIKDNKKQSSLTAAQRAVNVKGVYTVGKDSVVDKTILLIDDIYTTGATINECASVLKKSGAVLVYCATATITKEGKRFCASKNALAKLKK